VTRNEKILIVGVRGVTAQIVIVRLLAETGDQGV